ncbi:MAG: hypothetical protein J7M25_03795 [Deltaproteobacteria bacterium]|nr:hypothetical protein [Deltaproteobacteria bacterium]
MSPLYVILTVVGLLLIAVGGYLLGRWWEARLVDQFRGDMMRAKDSLDQEREAMRSALSGGHDPERGVGYGWDAVEAGEDEPLQQEAGETVIHRPSSELLHAAMPGSRPFAGLPPVDTGGFTAPGAPVPLGEPAGRGLTVEMELEMEMDADVPDRELSPQDMTRKISLDSADEMVALSHHVDVLTEDLSEMSRTLSQARKRIKELEEEGNKRKRRNAELGRLVDQLRGEIRRRDDRLRALLSELGVSVSTSDLEGPLASLAEMTSETKQLDISELTGKDTLSGDQDDSKTPMVPPALDGQ